MTLSFAQAQDHVHRMIAEMKSLRVLADVLDTAVQAEGLIASLKQEHAALLPQVDKLKSEIASLTEARDAEISDTNKQLAASKKKLAEANANAKTRAESLEAQHDARMKALDAEFSSRGDALRKEIASLREQAAEAQNRLDEAKVRFEEFRRSIPQVA